MPAVSSGKEKAQQVAGLIRLKLRAKVDF